MENALNPFKIGDRVATKFMGALVVVPVVQVYNREVQIRTADKVLRWRTCKTVWFPQEKDAANTVQPSPASVPEPVASAPAVHTPDQSVSVAPVPPPVSIAPSEPPTPKTGMLGITHPPVKQQFITVCGQEEAEELRRNRKAKCRTGRGKR